MRNIILIVVLTLSVFVTASAQPVKQKYKPLDLSMYPAATEGLRRVYIHLPVMKNERDLKVEIFIGREQMVDCNSYTLTGQVTEENLEGWGFTYYKVTSEGQLLGTLMGCPDNKKTKKFIQLPQPLLLNYNSKIPVVLYIPRDLEVRYKVWTAGKQIKQAKAG